MARKTIVTCAVTGNLTKPEKHPNLPITPRQIADAALDAAKAGASIAHIHVRDPETGKGSMDLNLYEQVVGYIREQNEELILNLTTGEGGRFIPSDTDPRIAASGSTLCQPEKRVAHVEKLRPDICTLDFNTMWSGAAAVINPPASVQKMAEIIYASGVKPEIEIFDSGDLHMTKHFVETGVLKGPLMLQLVLGVRFGAEANPDTLFFLANQLPDDCIWSAFGLGRHEFPIVAQSWLLGGHVRVGMEDNLHISKGKLCRDNAELVEKAVDIVEILGGNIATASETREMLGI